MQNGNAGGESVPGVDTGQISTATRAAPDWEAIRADYIAGMPVRACAKKYGVPYSTIGTRAARDRWSAARTAPEKAPPPNTFDDVAALGADEAIRQTAEDLARLARLMARAELVRGTAAAMNTAEAAARIAARAQQMILDAGRYELEKQRAGIDSGGGHIVIQLPDGCGD